jgi:quercetin dioxygenase-like cupin family protein
MPPGREKREASMLTRREFAGLASCAICTAAGLTATAASAEGTTGATTTQGLTRKILSQTDGPMPGYVTIIAEVQIEPGAVVARHTHPGIESGYVVEGNLELPIEGQPTRMLRPGDGFQVPTGTPHAGGKPSETRVKVTSTYVVEKGKPLASPV